MSESSARLGTHYLVLFVSLDASSLPGAKTNHRLEGLSYTGHGGKEAPIPHHNMGNTLFMSTP